MKKILILLFILTVSLFASIGQVSAVKGQAKLLRGSKSLDVVRGLKLEKKDTITTTKGTKIQMIFKDGTTISIGSKSKFNIAEYVFDEATPKASKTDFRFLKGAFKSITGRIGKIAPEKFKLKTRNASIGIRGTTVVGDQSQVACTYGKIAVTSKGVTVEVPAGMVTSTPPNAPPTPPVAYKAGSMGMDKEEKKEEKQEKKKQEKKSEKKEDKKQAKKSEKKEDKKTETKKSQKSEKSEAKQEKGSTTNGKTASKGSSNTAGGSKSTTAKTEPVVAKTEPAPVATEPAPATTEPAPVATEVTVEPATVEAPAVDTSFVESVVSDTTANAATDQVSTIVDDTVATEEAASTVATEEAASTVAETTTTTTTTTTTPPPPYTASLTGFGLFGVSDSPNNSGNSYLEAEIDKIEGTTFYNYKTSTGIWENKGTFSFTEPSLGGYTGQAAAFSDTWSDTYSYNGTNYPFTATTNVTSDNTAEFFVIKSTADISAQNSLSAGIVYNELTYVGAAPVMANLASNSVYTYFTSEHLKFSKDSSSGGYTSQYDVATEKPYIFLNTKTNSIFIADQKGFNAFKLNSDGTISGKSIEVYHNGSFYTTVEDYTGSLYGTNLQGIGVNGSGSEYLDYDGTGTQTAVETVQDVGAAYLVPNTVAAISNSGVVELSGYSNDTANNWGLISGMQIDRDSGDITGANFATSNQPTDYNVNFSGNVNALTSYYINDDLFGVMMSSGNGGSGNYIQNTGWLISIPDSVINGVAVVDNDNESSWGYWGGSFNNSGVVAYISPLSVWVAGNPTPTADINLLISDSINATFAGQVIGSVNQSDQILLDANNAFNMSIDFGGSSGNMSGSIAFHTKAGQAWLATFSGDATISGFTSSSVIGVGTANGLNVTTGKVEGGYFGAGLKSVGGRFDISNGTDQASGVFKANASGTIGGGA